MVISTDLINVTVTSQEVTNCLSQGSSIIQFKKILTDIIMDSISPEHIGEIECLFSGNLLKLPVIQNTLSIFFKFIGLKNEEYKKTLDVSHNYGLLGLSDIVIKNISPSVFKNHNVVSGNFESSATKDLITIYDNILVNAAKGVESPHKTKTPANKVVEDDTTPQATVLDIIMKSREPKAPSIKAPPKLPSKRQLINSRQISRCVFNSMLYQSVREDDFAV